MMRNIPFPFLMEETLETIAQRAQRVSESGIAKPVRLSRRAMEAHWPEIVEHKWFLSERLGRDAGNRVAAMDYAENIARISGYLVESTSFSEALRALAQRVGAVVETFISSRGVQAFSEVQRVMRGVPGSVELDSKKALPIAIDLQALHIPAHRIAQHSLEIQEHKWFLSERLGRDAGSKVAAVDYLENVKSSHAPKTLMASLAHVLEGMMEASGPNSLANLERALRAQNSLNP